MKPLKNITFVDITSEINNIYFNGANKYTDSKEGRKMLKISHICELYSNGCMDINDLITKLTNLTKASQTEIYELLQKYTDFEDYKPNLIKTSNSGAN